SEEMNAQSRQMRSIVDELATVVNGGDRHRAQVDPEGSGKGMGRGYGHKEARKTPQPEVAAVTKPVPFRGREVNPKDVIPMDEQDFQNF
ncbi:MAG: hypothetical protein JXL84_19075, partial [Deltaproteobacteria bacterium]|nr:hypothetical protein [Deltaproteobacteria bacterium]